MSPCSPHKFCKDCGSPLHRRCALPHYVIQRRDEETECDQCSAPLYVGDRAYYPVGTDQRDVGLTVFCSTGCGLRAGAKLERSAARA